MKELGCGPLGEETENSYLVQNTFGFIYYLFNNLSHEMEMLPKFKEHIIGTKVNLVARNKIKMHRNSTSKYCQKNHLIDYYPWQLKVQKETINYYEGYDDDLSCATFVFKIALV